MSRGVLSQLARSSSGNVLPLAAMGILLSAALVGGGVDLSRAYKAKTRLQAACDAGVLAGRRAVVNNGFDATALQTANSYFNVNFKNTTEGARNTVFLATSRDNGNTVNGSVTTEVSTLIMPIFGMTKFDLSVNCTASMGVGNSDVMMVLDTTGSMAWTAAGSNPGAGETSRIQDLRAAMKNFYDTVKAASAGSNTRVRYGFVPYSSSVNVGRLIYDKNPAYLVDSYAYQSRQWFVWEATPEITSGNETSAPYYDSSWTRISSPSYNSEASCQTAQPADTAWANNGSPSSGSSSAPYINDQGQRVVRTVISTQQQKKTIYSCIYRSRDGKWYVNYRGAYQDLSNYQYQITDPVYNVNNAYDPHDGIMYKKVTIDTSRFKRGLSTGVLIGEDDGDPAWVASTWNGCIMERQTVAEPTFTFTSGTGITPAGALDLDIDTAPTSSDTTKWAPMWPQVTFYRAAGTNYSLSGTQGAGACPQRAQLLTEMDESDFDNYADSLYPNGSTYHDIGILWGARLASPDGIWEDVVNDPPRNGGEVSRHLIFMTDGELAPTTTVLSSYGIERNDLRVTTTGSSTDQYNRHRSRFLALCEAVKAKGIRLWVVAFGSSLTTDLQTCSSTNSSYSASNAAQLNAAFQEIAKQVGELRVTL